MKKAARIQCLFCNTSFPRKSALLNHMKTEHGILQPYQCIACLKRFSSGETLYNHRRLYCRRKNVVKSSKLGTYSLSSFIYECQLTNWTPIFGDMLTCLCIDNDNLAVMYAGRLVGHVPRDLSSTFSKFLSNGTITARISGTVVDLGNGPEVPVDYMFKSNRQSLYKLIDSVEQQ